MIAVPREIVRIDPDLCNGCGLCVDKCAEAAIELVDDKARLVGEVYCDGLGACLDDCPGGAITIEQRLAEDFSEAAVEQRIQELKQRPIAHPRSEGQPNGKNGPHLPFESGGCPSSALRAFQAQGLNTTPGAEDEALGGSELSQWPVQLRLVPPTAPFLRGRELVVAADCVAYAYAGFHKEFLHDRSLVIGCPKLDDVAMYAEKLEAFFKLSGITGVTIVYMEVPCCFGIVHAVQQALEKSGSTIPLQTIKIGIDGRHRGCTGI